MQAENITFEMIGGERAISHLDELRALYMEVYAEPPYEWGEEHASVFVKRFKGQSREDGFALVEARNSHSLVGLVFGVTVEPEAGSSGWWSDVTSSLPAGVTAEWPGRTFAIVELLVRASWRRQHIAEAMHDLLLKDRPEERAMLTALPAAVPAQAAYRKWGWQTVAQKHNRLPGSPLFDVLVKALSRTA